MQRRITMIGAGSGFTVAIGRELVQSGQLRDCTFALTDPDAEALEASAARIRRLSAESGAALTVVAAPDLRAALDGADFVITSFAPRRVELWQSDIEIPERHGVYQLQGENGGPGGQIHALRNITILMEIARAMQELCPRAWLLNFTNPMSMLCTYLRAFSSLRWMGFCHQVHGSFGVVAEMLGMEPGDLQVISAGINHMNFLLDVRRKGDDRNWMGPFLKAVRESPYWRKNRENVPEQVFTLEFLDTFGIYPIGYDSHICEYLPFFYDKAEWEALDYLSTYKTLGEFKEKAMKASGDATGTIQDVEIWRKIGKDVIPFPKDVAHPYYKETPVVVMEALLTGHPQYMDAMVVENRGSVTNLPSEAVVDIPVVIAGGQARGIDVGELPPFAAELCRRQIVIHELIARAAAEGDRRLFLEALCLDPYVRGLSTARAIMADYLEAYREYLPQFQ